MRHPLSTSMHQQGRLLDPLSQRRKDIQHLQVQHRQDLPVRKLCRIGALAMIALALLQINPGLQLRPRRPQGNVLQPSSIMPSTLSTRSRTASPRGQTRTSPSSKSCRRIRRSRDPSRTSMRKSQSCSRMRPICSTSSRSSSRIQVDKRPQISRQRSLLPPQLLRRSRTPCQHQHRRRSARLPLCLGLPETQLRHPCSVSTLLQPRSLNQDQLLGTSRQREDRTGAGRA